MGLRFSSGGLRFSPRGLGFSSGGLRFSPGGLRFSPRVFVQEGSIRISFVYMGNLSFTVFDPVLFTMQFVVVVVSYLH